MPARFDPLQDGQPRVSGRVTAQAREVIQRIDQHIDRGPPVGVGIEESRRSPNQLLIVTAGQRFGRGVHQRGTLDRRQGFERGTSNIRLLIVSQADQRRSVMKVSRHGGGARGHVPGAGGPGQQLFRTSPMSNPTARARVRTVCLMGALDSRMAPLVGRPRW